MLPKIEYDQLYKFVVSLGVLLVAAAFAFPLLVLRAGADLRVPRDELDRLTPTARRVITTKQRSLEVTVHLVPVASPLLLAAGGATCWYGLTRWKRRQEEDDEQQRLDTTRKRKEVEAMSPTEIAAKHAAEAVDLAAPAPAAEKPPPSAIERRIEFLETYRDIERVLATKLVDAFSDEYDVRTNVRVGPVETDVLLEPRRPNARAVAVELKLLRTNVRANMLKRLDELRVRHARLTEHGDALHFVAFIVVPDAIAPKDRSNLEQRTRASEVAAIVLTESELASADRISIRRLVGEALAS